jgi:hypothetical protein
MSFAHRWEIDFNKQYETGPAGKLKMRLSIRSKIKTNHFEHNSKSSIYYTKTDRSGGQNNRLP